MADANKKKPAAIPAATSPEVKAGQTDGAAVAAGPMVEISCPSGPRRRAGLSFGPVPVTITAGELTPEQQDAIEGDAMLVLQPGRAAEEEPAPAA
jgi:hypothetical protein